MPVNSLIFAVNKLDAVQDPALAFAHISAALQKFTASADIKVTATVPVSALKGFKHKVDSRRYNGASLLGLRGVVVKSHGSADAFAFEQAIWRAAEAARNRLIERISERMERERSEA